MFEKYTLKQLRKVLDDFNKLHTINYKTMRKSKLLEEMEKLYYQLSPEIQGGGNKNSGYVRRLEAENKIDFNKIHNPTKFMIKKYRDKQVVVQEEPEYPEPDYQDEPPAPPTPQRQAPPTPQRQPSRQLFAPNEVLEFNVARPKPKKKRQAVRAPTETEEDRAKQREIEETNKEVERRVQLVGLYESLKKQIVELKDKLSQERGKYQKAYKELESRKGLRKQKKDEMLNKYSEAFGENIKNIKNGYPQVLKHIKEYKLDINDLNKVLIDVRKRMDRL